MIKFLSSLKLTAILIVSIVVMFLAGSFLTNNDSIYEGFKQMNNLIILDWFLNFDNHNTVIVIWFVVFCCLAALFGLNLILCTWDNLLKATVKRKGLKSVLLLTIHLVFTVILILHAVSLLIGFKYGNIKLSEGEEVKFENNYVLKLENINYIDNPKTLMEKKKSSRMAMTLDKFHYKENYASLTVCNGGQEILSGNAYIFSPLFADGMQFTLEKFTMDKKTGKLGAVITVTKNPLVVFFFIFYGLGILTMLAYLVVKLWVAK